MTWTAKAGALIVGAALLIATGAQAQILSQEPPMGKLREGERVLVDDGSCGPGRIREVIGGNHVEAGGQGRTRRVRRCISR